MNEKKEQGLTWDAIVQAGILRGFEPIATLKQSSLLPFHLSDGHLDSG